MTLTCTGLGSADPVGIQQLRRTYKYFKDYRQVCGDPFGGGGCPPFWGGLRLTRGGHPHPKSFFILLGSFIPILGTFWIPIPSWGTLS